LASELPRSRVQEIGRRALIFAISLVILGIIWQILAENSNPLIFSSPGTVANSLVNLFEKHNLVGALLSMLWLLFLGFGLSVLTGIPIGLTMGRVKIVDDIVDPYMTAFYVLPRVALIPLFIIWFGFGLLTSVLFVYTFSFFPIILIVSQGVKNTDKLFIEVAKVGCASEGQIFTKVIIPSSAPYIFASLRLGLSIALIGVVIAQLELVVTGVGNLLLNAQEFYRTDQILAILVVLAIVGYALSEFFRFIEGRVTRGNRLSTFAGM
jgi:ABC-type nitrate/sulfonate/bicarbonate transport system permease component